MVAVETEERTIYLAAHPRSRYLKTVQLFASHEVKYVRSHKRSLMMLNTVFILSHTLTHSHSICILLTVCTQDSSSFLTFSLVLGKEVL